MKADIEAMQKELLATVADLGGMATNLAEADDWASDGRDEEARISLEAVSDGASDAVDRLQKIALKCEEHCAEVEQLRVAGSAALGVAIARELREARRAKANYDDAGCKILNRVEAGKIGVLVKLQESFKRSLKAQQIAELSSGASPPGSASGSQTVND